MTSFGCRNAPVVIAPDVERALTTAYAEPHRAYHTATHIAAVLGWYDIIADDIGWRDPTSVYIAVLFHDVVYDPLAKDNEARSAVIAKALVDASARACALIELTARHGSLVQADVTGDPDAALFLDSDTAIVGASAAEFDAYDAAVAVEYKAVPPDAYRAGRRAFLTKMLAQPRIFLSDYVHGRLDAAARANLARAIAKL